MKKSIAVLAAATAFVVVASLAGCSSGSGSGSGDNPLKDVEASSLAPTKIMGLGPMGEESAAVSSADLSEEDLAAIKAKGIKVGIVMQTMDIEWSTEQVRGITDQV